MLIGLSFSLHSAKHDFPFCPSSTWFSRIQFALEKQYSNILCTFTDGNILISTD